jgi:RND family efflux transporter MFP subunit
MKKTIFIILGLAAVFTTIGVVLASNKKKIDAKNVTVDRSKIPVTVAVEKVAMGEFQGAMSFSGIVESAADADITVSAPGVIRSLNVTKGQWVRKGQVLGSIDGEQTKLQLKSLQLTEAKLATDLERVRTLVQGNAAPETNLKDLEYNLANTKIQIEQLNQRLVDNNILAPINGMITVKNMEAGEFVNPGMMIARIVDVSNLKVAVYVNEKHIYRIAEQQAATVTAEALPGKSFSCKVNYISPVGDENHNYRVEVQLDAEGNKALKSGTYTLVNLGTTEAGNGLMIPAVALVTGTDATTVFLVDGETVKSTTIVAGRRQGDMVEVLSGLKAGDQIVTAGQINLTDGSLISISNK